MTASDDPELEELRSIAEARIAAMLDGFAVHDVAFQRGAFGSTYERSSDRVTRYMACKVARSDHDGEFPGKGRLYFSVRLGQHWNWAHVSREYACNHWLHDEPDALDEGEFDAAIYCDLDFLVHNVCEWLVNWRTSDWVHPTTTPHQSWPDEPRFPTNVAIPDANPGYEWRPWDLETRGLLGGEDRLFADLGSIPEVRIERRGDHLVRLLFRRPSKSGRDRVALEARAHDILLRADAAWGLVRINGVDARRWLTR